MFVLVSSSKETSALTKRHSKLLLFQKKIFREIDQTVGWLVATFEICQSRAFLSPVFCRIRTDSTIISFYGKMRAMETLYSQIFDAVYIPRRLPTFPHKPYFDIDAIFKALLNWISNFFNLQYKINSKSKKTLNGRKMVMVKSNGIKKNGNAMLNLLSSFILLNLEILCFFTSDSILGKHIDARSWNRSILCLYV